MTKATDLYLYFFHIHHFVLTIVKLALSKLKIPFLLDMPSLIEYGFQRIKPTKPASADYHLIERY